MALGNTDPVSGIATHWTSNGAYPTNMVPPADAVHLKNGKIGVNGSHTSNGTTQSPQLRIAIVGGGLAGAATAIALSRLPDVQIKVYERSEEPREVGALIGVMVSALKSLSRILSPAGFETLQGLLYRGENVDGIINRFWRTGEVMTTQISPHTPRHLQEGRTGRVELYRLLLSEVPDGVISYGKKVLRLEKLATSGDVEGAKIRLHFADGSTEDTDLAVAADGLYSSGITKLYQLRKRYGQKLRKQYNPDETIGYRGRVAYRYTFPEELVYHIKDLPNDTSAWRSTSEAVFLSRINILNADPGVYSFLTFIPEPPEYAATLRWAKSIGKPGVDHLKATLAGWDPIIGEVLKVLPDADAYPLQAAPWMDSFIRDDAVVFVGDAAHPTSGDYGGGCSFAFADVRALYLSLWRTYDPTPPSSSKTKSHYDVPYSLHLYNETRRYFLKRVKKQMDNDRLDGAYIAGAGDDEAEWIRRYRERFTINWWLLEHDVDDRWQEVEADERHRYIKEEELKKAKLLKTIYGD